MNNKKALIRDVFKARKMQSGRCFEPTMKCENETIRAHSIQNSGSLDLIAEEGHVIAPVTRLHVDTGPNTEFERVGRRMATTFTGLCAEHDRALFSPIETGDIDFAKHEHLFLLAYRAVLYEVHATASVAVQVQTSYLSRIHHGFDPREDISPHGLVATQHIMNSFETFQYKTIYDEAFLTHNFERLQHEVLVIDVNQSTLGACALFSIDAIDNRLEPVRVCFNVLPTSPLKTMVVFSYLSEHHAIVKAELSRVLDSQGMHQNMNYHEGC